MPLHLVDSIPAKRLLINAGADVDAANNKGLRPIHNEAMECNDDLISLLLECGANPHALSGRSWNALDYVLVCMQNRNYRTADRVHRSVSALARAGLWRPAHPTLLLDVGQSGVTDLSAPLELLILHSAFDVHSLEGAHPAAILRNPYTLAVLLRYGLSPFVRNKREETVLMSFIPKRFDQDSLSVIAMILYGLELDTLAYPKGLTHAQLIRTHALLPGADLDAPRSELRKQCIRSLRQNDRPEARMLAALLLPCKIA